MRLTSKGLLNAVAAYLTRETGETFVKRYFATGAVDEFSSGARFYVEPGAFFSTSPNVASPKVESRVRLIVEEAAPFGTLDATIETRRDFLENLARDLLKNRGFVSGAWLAEIRTFSDAPGGFLVDAAQSDFALFEGGFELTFYIE